MLVFVKRFVVLLSVSLLLAAEPLPIREITLQEARELVLLNNFEIASQKLGMASARELFQGEKGALWEPVLVAGVNQVSNERENNTEEFIRQGVEDFSEENTLYNAGIEQPLPTGGSLQLTYNVDNLTNNLQEQRELDFEEKEFDSFAGVTFVQPLLKNGGAGNGTFAHAHVPRRIGSGFSRIPPPIDAVAGTNRGRLLGTAHRPGTGRSPRKILGGGGKDFGR